MLILENTGKLIWNGHSESISGPNRDAIELPVELVLEQSNVFDQLFALAFDVLDLQALDIRIRRTWERERAETSGVDMLVSHSAYVN